MDGDLSKALPSGYFMPYPHMTVVHNTILSCEQQLTTRPRVMSMRDLGISQ